MAIKVRESVPISVLRLSDGADDGRPFELTAYRFMGCLMHPVPRSEMVRRCGVDHRGCRLVVQWPRDLPGDHPVAAGDRLQIGGETHTVAGVRAYPGLYLEVYVLDR